MASSDDSLIKQSPTWLHRWADLFVDNLYEYAVLITDLSGIVLTWHPGVRQVLGYEQEIIGQPLHVIFTEEDRLAGRPETEFAVALREGSANDERWHIKKDGSRFWAMGIMTAIYDESGEPVGFSKLFQDKTESKELSLALGASESRFRGTFEQAAVGIAHLNQAGQFVRFNHKLLQVLGYEDELPDEEYYDTPSTEPNHKQFNEYSGANYSAKDYDDVSVDKGAPADEITNSPDGQASFSEADNYDQSLAGTSFLDLLHPKDLELTQRIFPRLIEGIVSSYKHEVRLLKKDASYLWSQISMSKTHDAYGEFKFMTVVVEDISVRKQIEVTLTDFNANLETQVLARTQQVRELARDISMAEQRERQRISQLIHDDLQQQLYALQISLHELQSDLNLPTNTTQELSSAYELITTAITTARTLSADLNPLSFQQESFSDNVRILAEQVANLHNLAIDVNVLSQSDDPPDRISILLLQITRELLFNVVKHAGTEAATVTLKPTSQVWQLDVQDQGRGFDLSILNNKDNNNHLGLTSIRQRLALFDGEFKVSSTLGEGTLASVVIPKDEKL